MTTFALAWEVLPLTNQCGQLDILIPLVFLHADDLRAE